MRQELANFQSHEFDGIGEIIEQEGGALPVGFVQTVRRVGTGGEEGFGWLETEVNLKGARYVMKWDEAAQKATVEKTLELREGRS